MSRELNPAQIWSQVPVANRTIEVNTKTGFSLTAGSYSIRASSVQRMNININTPDTNITTSCSAVTTTRAYICGYNQRMAGTFMYGNAALDSTTVNSVRISTGGGNTTFQIFHIVEVY